MKPINECKTVAELLESPERWIKGKAWSNSSGQFAIDRTDAACFCAIGAIAYIYGDEYGTCNGRCLEQRKKLEPIIGTSALAEWNDAPERTHAEVLNVVRQAGI
jgi:hypothetical protein